MKTLISLLELNYCRNLCPALLPPRPPVNQYNDRIILLLSVVEFLFSVSPENVWHLCNISNFILTQQNFDDEIFRMNLNVDEIRSILSEILKLLSTPEFQTQLEKSRQASANDAVALLQSVSNVMAFKIKPNCPSLFSGTANYIEGTAGDFNIKRNARTASDSRF